MAKGEALALAYILDGQGGGRRIGWQEIADWTPQQGILWIHLNYEVKKAHQWLVKQSGLNKIIAKALMAEETRPRSVITPHGLLIFLRGVNLNPGEDPEDMVSVRLWIEEHRIISTRRRSLLSIEDLSHAIDEGNGPKTSSEFIVSLNDRLTDRMSDVIEHIDEKVDFLEEKVLSVQSHLLRPQIADLRRQAIVIRRYLAPQREALTRLQMGDVPLLNHNDVIYLRESTDRIVRHIEDLDSLRDRLAITQEELASRLAEQMNKRIYLLSVVAVIFLPLTFITGLLGMNVAGIPGAQHPWAFTIVCFGLLGLLFFTLLVCRLKKWI